MNIKSELRANGCERGAKKFDKKRGLFLRLFCARQKGRVPPFLPCSPCASLRSRRSAPSAAAHPLVAEKRNIVKGSLRSRAALPPLTRFVFSAPFFHRPLAARLRRLRADGSPRGGEKGAASPPSRTLLSPPRRKREETLSREPRPPRSAQTDANRFALNKTSILFNSGD